MSTEHKHGTMSLTSRIRRNILSPLVSGAVGRIAAKVQMVAKMPFAAQQSTFDYLLSRGGKTCFGREHDFASISNYKDFKRRVPLRDYEDFKPYIQALKAGKKNVLWPGRPVAFAYTSGTTSGHKYIPVTTDFLGPYCRAARNAVSLYIARTGNAACITGNLFYFTHNIEIERFNGTTVRPIAGIAKAHTPFPVRRKFSPCDRTNSIVDYEQKIDVSVRETIGKNITLISGIPPWLQLYFNKMIRITGRSVIDNFPDFSLLIHGGVSMEPYRTNLFEAVGKKVDTLELYPASEGFIGFQDRPSEPGLLLNLMADIYYEFIPEDEMFSTDPVRLNLQEITTGVNYAIVLNTSAGLWGYVLGDLVQFVSTSPYRFVIAGRTTQFIETTGEHLIAADVESALSVILKKGGVRITDLTIAPQIHPAKGLPFHEWLVEFEKSPEDLDLFAAELNRLVGQQNINYEEFCEAGVLLPLKITPLLKGTFAGYMKSIGRLGEQNKVPLLLNNRILADALLEFMTTAL